MNKIIFATNNRHKIEEVQALLGSRYTVVSPAELGFDGDIPENQSTLEGNAMEKSEFIHSMFNLPCFADDTGLEVDALNGAPGVYSARYAGEDKDSHANIRKLLDEMKDKNNRKARFRCVISLIDEKGVGHLFEGRVEGEILHEPVGGNGFGYDSVFRPDGYNLSFAQMSLSEKNPISHRGNAVKKLTEYLTETSCRENITPVLPRIGNGYDVHVLAEGYDFWLGGIKIEHDKGCVAHSDGDTLIHAICDALLGAAALGDIGMHFPDNSAEFKGIDSKILLRRTVNILKDAGYLIGNIDATVCLQRPKIRLRIDEMRETLAELMEISADRVSVKATTTEKLGFVGREEGIAVYATALIYDYTQT
jgi:non-canonical purine NTP pyrophosphatase (RdgB/HAM1 family)